MCIIDPLSVSTGPSSRVCQYNVCTLLLLLRFIPVCAVSQSTGRVAGLKRWENGLHQAVEAKEGLEVKVSPRYTAGNAHGA